MSYINSLPSKRKNAAIQVARTDAAFQRPLHHVVVQRSAS